MPSLIPRIPLPPAWKRRLRHPMAPVAVFVAWSLAVGECYPLSNYSMYSRPTPRPLRVYYVVDGEGEPLPIQWHTGQSPAAITKTFRHYESGIERDIARGRREEVAVETIKAEAGERVLAWLRELSVARAAGRPERTLDGTIQLVEITISAPGRGLREEQLTVAADAGPDGGQATDGVEENSGHSHSASEGATQPPPPADPPPAMPIDTPP